MDDLKNEPCEGCRADAPLVTEAEIAELLPHVSGWHVVEVEGIKQLQREFNFTNFAEALAFTNKVGELAESVGHHPDILTQWGKVTVAWWTHKIKGLHRNDFILASRTSDL